MVKNINKIADFQKALKANNGEIMHDLSSQVLADCNKYVRVMAGDMRASSYVSSVLNQGKLVWDTPYAKKVYYAGTPNTQINPNASLMWCEVARTNHKEDWLKILKNAVNEYCLESDK